MLLDLCGLGALGASLGIGNLTAGLAFCYGVTALGALWYFKYEKRAAAELRVTAPAETGTDSAWDKLEALISTYLGVPVLVLAFLVPYLWARDVFWKVILFTFAGLGIVGSVKQAHEKRDKREAAALWLLCSVLCAVAVPLVLHWGSDGDGDGEAALGSASGSSL